MFIIFEKTTSGRLWWGAWPHHPSNADPSNPSNATPPLGFTAPKRITEHLVTSIIENLGVANWYTV
jgi:hypothetical protein